MLQLFILVEYLEIISSYCFQCSMETYVSRFQWDLAKFPLRQPLPGIVDGISKVKMD